MPSLLPGQTVLPLMAVRQIEGGLLANLNVPNLMLRKGERCHFVDKTYYVLEHKITRHIRSSKSISVPSIFFKGVRYSCRKSEEEEPIEKLRTEYLRGYLYITNKRIIFSGKATGMERTLDNLSLWEPYSNAIRLQFGQKIIHFILQRSDLAARTLQKIKQTY